MTIEVWLTAGLLSSAVFQAWSQWWGGMIAKRAADAEADRRRKERYDASVLRERAAEADQDAAFFAVWAESFRIESLADQWKSKDLVEMSVLNLLDPTSVVSRDPQALLRSAVRISHEAGYLATVAVTLSQDTAWETAQFNQAVAEVVDRTPTRYQAASGVEKLAYARKAAGEELDVRANRLRDAITELATLWNDAAMQTKRAALVRSLNFTDTMRSDFGRGAVRALQERGEQHHN